MSNGTFWHLIVPALVLGAVCGCSSDGGDEGTDKNANPQQGTTGGKSSSSGGQSSASSGGRSSGTGGQSTASTGGQAEGTGGETTESACEAKAKAFTDFVAAHRDCSSDDDCKIVGDCGPNADFDAVNTQYQDEAYSIQSARCASWGTWDGPLFEAKCVEAKCALEQLPNVCCGCLPDDAGP